MRRILSALLISTIAATAPLAPPVGAVGVSQPLQPVAPTTTQATHHPWPNLYPRLRRPHSAINATRHLLAVAAAAMRLTIDQLRAEWQHVAICEVGGNWAMVGSAYSGIGFANSTWSSYGGSKYAPYAGQASKDQQILIGMKVTKTWVPDQNGCARGGW